MTVEVVPRRRHPVRNAFIGLFVCVAMLAITMAVGVLYLQHTLTSDIGRIDGVFAGLDQADRPTKPTSGPAAKAVNILLMGTDRRSPVGTTGPAASAPLWIPGAQRTDTLMVLHIDGDRRGASVISIPRDSWVAVPGYGMDKINAAFSYAGPSLAVQTVEQLTGVRIDHLAVIDWEGFRELTDALGGVTVNVPATVRDSVRNITWTAGTHTLDGEQALAYVGQRYGLPGGDLDRVRRQQAFLRTLMVDSLRPSVRHHPLQVLELLRTVTRNLSIDSGWSTRDLAGLALSLRNLRPADIHYLTVPVAGLGMEGAQSVVHLDPVRGLRLWSAVRDDHVETWADHHAWYEADTTVR